MEPKHLGEALPRLVDRLVASYLSDPRTQHIDRDYLPARSAIIDICDMLLELTYPGYIGRMGLNRHNISYHVGELLPKLWEQLTEQMTQCLCHERENAGALAKGGAPCTDEAVRLANLFLERIPDVREKLAFDVQAAYDGDPAASGAPEIILAYPGVLAITIYRYAHELYEMSVPLMPRIMSEHAHILTGIDIHPGAQIGRSFFIDHGTGVVIGETAVIGDHVKIYQGVTLGALSFPKDERGRIIRGHKRHPTVGSNVTLYANAIVLGGETAVGDGSIIGGSVFLTQSVAPGHQVSISPPVLRVRPPKPGKAADAR
jgi:serine O-acetyltransferase